MCKYNWQVLMVAAVLTAWPCDTSVRQAVAAEVDSGQLSPFGNAAIDPAFDQYFRVQDLHAALNALDASAVADIAYRLADGERILMRTHRILSSDVVLAAAIRIAQEQDDHAMLNRIRDYATRTSAMELVQQIDSAERLNKASRQTLPGMDLQQTTPEDYGMIYKLQHRIRRARVLHDRDELQALRRLLVTVDGLSAEQLSALQNEIDLALESETDSGLPAGFSVLSQLAEESRASVPCSQCSTLGYYMTTEMRGSGIFKTKVPVRKKCERCGGSGYLSTKPLENNLKNEQAQREARAQKIARSVPWEMGIVQISNVGKVYLNGQLTNGKASRGSLNGRQMQYYNRLLSFPGGTDAWFQWYRFDNESSTKKRQLNSK